MSLERASKFGVPRPVAWWWSVGTNGGRADNTASTSTFMAQGARERPEQNAARRGALRHARVGAGGGRHAGEGHAASQPLTATKPALPEPWLRPAVHGARPQTDSYEYGWKRLERGRSSLASFWHTCVFSFRGHSPDVTSKKAEGFL